MLLVIAAEPDVFPMAERRIKQFAAAHLFAPRDWEIARILGLSLETVRQYVKRARAAYGTVSRTQLAIYGLRDAWVSFDEAIPPDGGMG